MLDTKTYTYGDTSWGDLLTGYGGWTFSYDEIGNVTQAGAFTYTWEHGRQLANMTSSTADIDFTYDSDGMRVGKTVTSGSTVTDYDYIYNGSQLTGEVITTNDSAETLYYSYDASGTPVSVKYNNTLYFYLTNLQGDVIAIMNGSGTIVVEYTYDAWGYIRNTSGSMKDTLGKANALRYRGYVYDTETCLYYLQSRYYNPGTGRFINADALVITGQGLLGNNMFAYCRNNPVSRRDIAGTDDEDCISDETKEDLIYQPEGSSLGTAQANSDGIPVAHQGNSGSSKPPQAAKDVYSYVKTHNGSPPPGYKGGKIFENDGRRGGQVLPNQYGPFREYDIYPATKGVGRGTERIVIGDGIAWYTSDHYETFWEMR